MIIGSFGMVSFQASSSLTETINNLKWTSSASYHQHKVHGQMVVPEFTGLDADKIVFDMTLSAYLGINPSREMQKLKMMLESRTYYPLILGTDYYGRWLLTNLSRDVQYIHKNGELLQAKVNVTLVGMV